MSRLPALYVHLRPVIIMLRLRPFPIRLDQRGRQRFRMLLRRWPGFYLLRSRQGAPVVPALTYQHCPMVLPQPSAANGPNLGEWCRPLDRSRRFGALIEVGPLAPSGSGSRALAAAGQVPGIRLPHRPLAPLSPEQRRSAGTPTREADRSSFPTHPMSPPVHQVALAFTLSAIGHNQPREETDPI